MTITRAPDMTPAEREYMKVPPYIVTETCECGHEIYLRTYETRRCLEQDGVWCRRCGGRTKG